MSRKPGDVVFDRTFPPITRHTLALYCGASGDHNPLHVDIDFAHRAGFQDVFAHGMLVMAYLGRALTDAYPITTIRRFETRFVAMTQVGAIIQCTGCLLDVAKQANSRSLQLGLSARDQHGDKKLVGHAIVSL